MTSGNQPSWDQSWGQPENLKLGEALRSGQFSDLKIKCKSKVFLVHRVVVCYQSKVLEAACSEHFKEGQTGVIDLSEDDSDLVARVLEFLYESKYEGCSDLYDLRSQLNFDVGMYIMADKYHIPRLRDYARASTQKTLECINEAETLLENIPRIYEATPDSEKWLRASAVQCTRRFYERINADEKLKQVFHGLIQTIWQFNVDLLESFAAMPILKTCLTCGHWQEPSKWRAEPGGWQRPWCRCDAWCH